MVTEVYIYIYIYIYTHTHYYDEYDYDHYYDYHYYYHCYYVSLSDHLLAVGEHEDAVGLFQATHVLVKNNTDLVNVFLRVCMLSSKPY